MNRRFAATLLVVAGLGCLKPAPPLPPKLTLSVLAVKQDGTSEPLTAENELKVGGQLTIRANVQRPGFIYVFVRASNAPKLVWGDGADTPKLEVGEFEMEPPYAILYKGDHLFTAVISPERLTGVATWTDLSEAAIKKACPMCSVATAGATVQ